MRKMQDYVVTRIGTIEKELDNLRTFINKQEQKKIVRLEGLWKGIEISEKDIERSKRALFKNAYRFRK